jgi:FkbM family methyltransferase
VSRTATALRILGLRLPWRARLGLLAFALRRRLGAPGSTWHSPGGDLVFGEATRETDWRVFAEIFLERDYETDYRETAVVDLGAHKGYFGAYALLNGARAVLSYEPEEQNFALLARNNESFRNRRASWQIEHAAVGAAEREAVLRVAGESWAHSLVPGDDEAPETVQRARVLALSRVVDRARGLGGSRLLLKLDVEGSECEIVLSSPLSVWDGVDEVFVETHAFAPCSADELIARLRAAGLTPTASSSPHVLHLVRSSANA